MASYLQVQISSALTLPAGQEMYIYIIGGVSAANNTVDYYSWHLSTDGNYVATQGSANTVYAIALSSLGTDSNSVPYFNFDQSQGFSGRIWFSSSNSLLTISDNQVTQPDPSSGLLFDFVELTLTASQDVNLDTSQVTGLGIPITVINPAVLTFPPQTPYTDYTFPNAVGIVPGNSLQGILSNFSSYLNQIGLSAYSVCAQSYTATGSTTAVSWLINPGYMVPAYDSSITPSGLSVAFDNVLYEFFNFFYAGAGGEGGTLTIQYNSIVYTGQTVVQAGLDPANSTQEYCALIFTDPDKNTYPVFYPYFTTNSASTQGGSLNPQSSLPPPPGWWTTNNLPSTTPASGQVLLNNGVFNDQNPNVVNGTILAELQNIVVTLINRGLIPGATMNNLFVCNGQLSLTVEPVSFQDSSPNCSLNGASLIYAPSQIPPDAIVNANVSGSIVLNNGDADQLTQSFSDNIVSIPASPPANYCQSPVVVQLAPVNGQQQTNFVFDYVSAVWTTAPQLTPPVSVTYYPTIQSAMTATFAGTGFSADIAAGMNVLDVNVQNPSSVTAATTTSISLQSSINGLLPSPNPDTLLIGNFYPTNDSGAAVGSWNAFAGFLHYGGNGIPAPYISNQGYAFAYDDDGGYSSDVTVNFPASGNCSIGIYLGPLS
jgi:hypothetical protein